jgi:hypothetical protein
MSLFPVEQGGKGFPPSRQGLGRALLTGGLFEYRDLGTVSLKGFAEDVPAWQVLGDFFTPSTRASPARTARSASCSCAWG